MTEKRTSTIESIQICLVFCLIVVSTNLFLPIYIIGETQFLLGSVFVFLSLLILPITFSVVVATCFFISQIAAEQFWTISVLFILEFTVIAFLYYRNIVLLIASLLFWLVIGVPLLCLLNAYSVGELADGNIIISLQAAFNGLLNAAIAATIYTFIPYSWQHSKAPQHSLATNIFAICASTLVVPLLIASFVFISQYSKQREASTAEGLHNKSLLVAQLSTDFIAKHQSIVEQAASAISKIQNTEIIHTLLIEAQARSPTFFNLVLTNTNGDLDFFAPTKYKAQVARMPPEVRNIQDREYFTETKTNLSTTISNAILSRGIVVAPMVSIAAPFFSKSESQAPLFKGVIFGALNLSSLNNEIEEMIAISKSRIVIITDRQNNFVFSTRPKVLKTLSPFVYSSSESILIKTLPMLRINDKNFLYHKTTTKYGWNVFVIEDAELFSKGIRDQFLWVGLGLLIVLALFLLFAYKLSTKITSPLIALLQNEDELPPEIIESNETSREFSDMAKKLKRSSYLMKNYENRLKLQVEEKTEKLEQLNLLLAAQAREDSLTGLLNRSGFNELALNAIKTSYRLAQPFSVAILDLDFFKVINDTYGHPFGDTCLIEFANLLHNHCKRETDIIGRYGGEEFVIYISGADVSSQHKIINRIHESTQNIEIKDPKSQKSVNFTVSIGVCTVLTSANLELSDLIKIADEELYNCKRNGRNQMSICEIGER